MPRFALVLLMGGLLLGASKCDDEPAADGGVSEGEGSSGASGSGEDDDNGNAGGEPCGPNTCDEGQVCCNESCGICTDPDGVCTQQFCVGDAGVVDPGGAFCGGIAGIECEGDAVCVDDPSDDCDPDNGGADCGGICQPSDGGSGGGEECGNVTCGAGEVCCNESCGICTEPGGFCTEQFCGDPDPEGEACGPNTCAAGEVCCNESCGICTEPGGGCTKQFCDDTDPDPEFGPFCGGFGGFGCPGAGDCADDPRDDCDPENGGADCGGVCECNVSGLCEDGNTWNDSPEVCACEAASGDGEECGNATCPTGQVCCNASCGICAPPDGACIQIACL